MADPGIELRAHYQNENGIGHTRWYNTPVLDHTHGDLNRLLQTPLMSINDVHHGILSQPIGGIKQQQSIEKSVPPDMRPASMGPYFLQSLRLTANGADMQQIKQAFREDPNMNFFTMEQKAPPMGTKMYVDLKTRGYPRLPESEGHDLASNTVVSSNNTNPRVPIGKASAREAKKKDYRADILKKLNSRSKKP